MKTSFSKRRVLVLCVALIFVISGIGLSVFSVGAEESMPEGGLLGKLGHLMDGAVQCGQKDFANREVWPDYFVECVAPALHQWVGELCLSIEWLCTDASAEQWIPGFLLRQAQVSDVLVAENSLTVIGGDEKHSWRLHVMSSGVSGLKNLVVFSRLQ